MKKIVYLVIMLISLLCISLLTGCVGLTPSPSTTQHECNYLLEKLTEPSCETKGIATYACKCGKTYTETENAYGHSYGAYVSNNNATCTTYGTETAECYRCGKADTRQGDTYASHVYTVYNYNNDGTCTVHGTETATCDVCHVQTETRLVAPFGHEMGEYVFIGNATCTSDGYMQSTCQNGCGYSEFEIAEGTRLPCTHMEWIANDDDTMTSYCEYCDIPQTKPIPECDHNLALMIGSSHGSAEYDRFLCSACEVSYEIEDVLVFTLSDSELSGYALEIESKIPTVELSIVGLSQIKPYYYKNLSNDITYEAVEDVASNATELVIGENISVIWDLYTFERIKRLTLGEDVVELKSRTIENCAWLSEIYMLGDCPTLEENAFYVSTRIVDDVPTSHIAPTVYYLPDKLGYSGFKIQGCTLAEAGGTLPEIPYISVTEYSQKTVEKGKAYASMFFEEFEANGNGLEYMPKCSLEKYYDIFVLANTLTEGLQTDKEKAEAIFNWIVANLEYDMSAQYYTVDQVYESKKAVCNGYAILMHDMLCAVGIPSLYTHGISIASDEGLTINDLIDGSHYEKFEGSHHAWLQIYADGEVILCDPTWGEFDVSAEELSSTRLTLGIYGITIAPDEIDPRHYSEYLYVENDELYHMYDGKLTNYGSIEKVFNLSFSVAYQISTPNDGYEYLINGEEATVRCAYKNTIIEYCDTGYRFRFFFDGAYNAYDYLSVLKGVAFAKLYFDYDFEIPFKDEFAFDEYGNIYLILSDTELELIGTICSDKSITVPEAVGERTVVGIGWGAFAGCYAEGIVLPNTITYISSTAFWNCGNLTEITIPNSVKELGVSIFTGCVNLEAIYLPSSIEFIGLKDNKNSCLPYQMFSDLDPEKLKVYYDGTKDEFDKISFYNPWNAETGDPFDKEHYDHIIEFMVFQ